MDNNILSLLSKRIDESAAYNSVIVLKGFLNSDLLMLSKKLKPIGEKLPIDSKNLIDLEVVKVSLIKMITELGQPLENKRLMCYESFFNLVNNFKIENFPNTFLIITNNLLEFYPNQTKYPTEDYDELIEKGQNIDDNLFTEFYSHSKVFGGRRYLQYIGGLAEYNDSVEEINLIPDEKKLPPIKSINEFQVPKEFITFRSSDNSYIHSKDDLFRGDIKENINLLVDDTIKGHPEMISELKALNYFMNASGLKCSIFKISKLGDKKHRPMLDELLKNHWQSDSFRELTIYSDPEVSNETIEISQASVVETIITEYENAQKDISYSDIFLTAPTGAGKSLLFQLPAIYLEQTYNAVSIVISPLIALMKDQVFALKKDRNYDKVAYINSELSLIEREDIIEKVKTSEISVLYMSPELLLSYDLSHFIGERQLGLLVLDEAHLVTTWGRDFRVDYWYLGNFIRKIRKYYDSKFPVMAVTATAVYDGPNDIVFDTLESLNLDNTIKFIGRVRRDDISFDIQELSVNTHESDKINKTVEQIEENVNNKTKSIVYCPWTRQIQIIKGIIKKEMKDRVDTYFGSMDKDLKQDSYQRFLDGKAEVIVATKAFGMGVDIDDIKMIYHHAPSGHLADYVQEIGRCARRTDIEGIAKTDFNSRDLKFTRILYGLSSLKQYQLQLVLDKINKIYLHKRKRNLLISVNDFEYIFNFARVDVAQKVKSALLLLERDLLKRYNYNVLIVRPKSLFTTVFLRVNNEANEQFLNHAGDFAKQIPNPRVEAKNQKVYHLDLDRLWEKYFYQESFPYIKKKYYDKELFEEWGLEYSPQYRVTYILNENKDVTFNKLTAYFDIINSCFSNFNGFFTKNQLIKTLSEKFKNKLLAKRVSDLILSIYTSEVEFGARGTQLVHGETFLQQRRKDHEYEYRVINKAYPRVRGQMRRRFVNVFGNLSLKDRDLVLFIPVDKKKNIGLLRLAYIIETFNLGSYEISGGESPSIFVRINDPLKIDVLSREDYKNGLLSDIENRHKSSIEIMNYFFTRNMDDKKRWDFIEDYFLGAELEELITS